MSQIDANSTCNQAGEIKATIFIGKHKYFHLNST